MARKRLREGRSTGSGKRRPQLGFLSRSHILGAKGGRVNELNAVNAPGETGVLKQNKTKRPSFRRGALRQNCSYLEQIPQELVVDLMMKLDFLCLDEGSQRTGTTVGGGLLQVGISAFYVFA